VAAPSDLMQKLAPGSLGGTYGGNAVACAAAVGTINVRRGWGWGLLVGWLAALEVFKCDSD